MPAAQFIRSAPFDIASPGVICGNSCAGHPVLYY